MAWSVEAFQEHMRKPEAEDVVELNIPIMEELGVFSGKYKPRTNETDLEKLIRKEKRKANQDRLRKAFSLVWAEHGDGIELSEEVKFHEKRRWRFDFCHEGSLTGIELEGGTNSRKTKSRHTTPEGYRKDREKYNAATHLGWVVISLTSDMIDQQNIEQIVTIIKERLK